MMIAWGSDVRVLEIELRPTLDAPAEVDVPRYVEDLFARFANAALDHRTCQVASDGSAKLPVRVTGAVLHHTARGTVPRLLALTVTAYVRCLATPGAYDAGRLGAIADPERERLEELGRRVGCSRALVEAVFASGIFDPALGEATAFVEAVAELYAVLAAHGHGRRDRGGDPDERAAERGVRGACEASPHRAAREGIGETCTSVLPVRASERSVSARRRSTPVSRRWGSGAVSAGRGPGFGQARWLGRSLAWRSRMALRRHAG
jgi:hypothetical protein